MLILKINGNISIFASFNIRKLNVNNIEKTIGKMNIHNKFQLNINDPLL